MKLYERLKIAIKNSRYNQKQIAKHFKWTEATLSRIIKGEADPGVSKIEKIANYLNINFTWLFTGRGPVFYEDVYQEYPVTDETGSKLIISENNQYYDQFNRTTDEFTNLALEIIRDEQITQEELVAAVREVRRRRRQNNPSRADEAKPMHTLSVKELDGGKNNKKK